MCLFVYLFICCLSVCLLVCLFNGLCLFLFYSLFMCLPMYFLSFSTLDYSLLTVSVTTASQAATLLNHKATTCNALLSFVSVQATTVFAADAVSRLSGVIGVAAVTAGPGVTNTVTAVKNAQMAQSPVLLLGGAAPTLLQVEHH